MWDWDFEFEASSQTVFDKTDDEDCRDDDIFEDSEQLKQLKYHGNKHANLTSSRPPVPPRDRQVKKQ